LNPIQVRYLAALRPANLIIAKTFEVGKSPIVSASKRRITIFIIIPKPD
jgi:hypothetical protein